jgi:general secretion pathway protein H
MARRQAQSERYKAHKAGSAGFTLVELLVVIAIVAVGTAGVGLAMRGTADSALEREALRLAVFFESARAQSRASGIAVVWRTTAEGTTTRDTSTVQLGPEPIIGPQAVELVAAPLPQTIRIRTEGLRSFAVDTQGQP